MCQFSSGNWFFCTKCVQLAVACTSKKEYNKLDLTTAQYFGLVDHNDWSRWFAISSPQIYVVPVTVLLVGLPKKRTAKLRHLILLSRVTYLSTGGGALRSYSLQTFGNSLRTWLEHSKTTLDQVCVCMVLIICMPPLDSEVSPWWRSKFRSFYFGKSPKLFSF